MKRVSFNIDDDLATACLRKLGNELNVKHLDDSDLADMANDFFFQYVNPDRIKPFNLLEFPEDLEA